MRTRDFDYALPPELVAQTPSEPRDHSRLLVLYRETGRIEHRRFHQVTDYLKEGDLLVLNDSRVIPARLHGQREGTGGRVELLLLRRLEPGRWEALGRPGRRLRPGVRLHVAGAADGPVEVRVVESREDGIKVVELASEEGLERVGQVPLPPYIREPLSDPERYQTVYARTPGSVAAPTAGLHFTEGLLDEVRQRGVHIAFITLHVGLDTFRPVTEDDPRKHRLHSEAFTLGQCAARELNSARQEGRRIVAVGTTTVRVLEQASLRAEDGGGVIEPASGWTGLFILPGYRFRTVQALVTNFHLPRSTLLMLVCAFAGRERVLAAYQEAIKERYRFYSFGDCMFII